MAEQPFLCAPFSYSGIVARDGSLSYWKALDVIKVGDHEIPLFYNFSSASGRASPHFGRGWAIPLLESKMFLLDENKFGMLAFDGRTIKLSRKSKNSAELIGCGTTGKIEGNLISVTFDTGWRFTYIKGILQNLVTPDHHRLDFTYSDSGVIRKIVADARDEVVSSVLGDGSLGISELRVHGRSYKMLMASRPSIQEIAGQRLVGEMTASLRGILKDGLNFGAEFLFGVSDEMAPTLVLAHENGRRIEWDSKTFRVTRDSESNLVVEAGPGFSAKRFVGERLLESLRFNEAKGEYDALEASGTKISVRRHVAGALAGLWRTASIVQPDGQELTSKFSYDEKGQLLRTITK